jgi:hypothetical protein
VESKKWQVKSENGHFGSLSTKAKFCGVIAPVHLPVAIFHCGGMRPKQ